MKSLQKAGLLTLLVVLISGYNADGQSKNNSNSDYRIYFSLRESEDQNIKIVSYDGQKISQFKVKNGNSARGINKPSVSADGKWIAFNTYQFGGWKTAIAKIDGSSVRQVSESRNYSGFPSFSKDGKWILFYEHENGRNGSRDIYKVRFDGSEKTQLTRNSKHHYSPAFSPDGSKISLVSARDSGNYEIFVMNSDGTNLTNITKHSNHDANPSWSPDGKKIAFLSIRDNYLNLYTINPDGTGLKNLTNNQENGTNSFVQTSQSVDELSYMYGTSWSPDGKSIVFVQKEGGIQKLYMINSDGTNVRKLVETKGNQFNPFWARKL